MLFFSQAATYANLSSLLFASPSSVNPDTTSGSFLVNWCSSLKWPPQLSSRCNASLQSNSAKSIKSATLPAFSNSWLMLFESPGTLRLDQNSSLILGIFFNASFNPDSVLDIPHLSQTKSPSSRWKESTLLLPLMFTNLFILARTFSSASLNSGISVFTELGVSSTR